MITQYQEALKAQRESREATERGEVFTNCTFCKAVIHYEKGKKFFDCPECHLTNYREGK